MAPICISRHAFEVAFFIGLLISNDSVWARNLRSTDSITKVANVRVNSTLWPTDDGTKEPISIVNLSELKQIPDFKKMRSLHVQLQEGGQQWEFRRDEKTTKKDYFVGITKNRGARASFFRQHIASINVNHLTGIIHDNYGGRWYEVKPNIQGESFVSVVEDSEIAPFGDPVVSSSIPNPVIFPQMMAEETEDAWEESEPTTLDNVVLQTRTLLQSFLPTGWAISDDRNDTDSSNKEDTVVDIMVVWTHKAECIKSHLLANCTLTATSRQNMKLAILFFLEETNAVFRNSGLHLQLRLSHGQRAKYQESTFARALDDLKQNRIPLLTKRRKEHKADMVMLLMDQTNDNSETGIAYNNYGHIDAEYMYSVVAAQYTSIWYLPAHEIGHLFGCSHDRGTADACDYTEKTSYGYRDPRGQFRTIMAYPCQARQCDDTDGNNFGTTLDCPIIPYFSNDRADGQYYGASLGGTANNCVGQIEQVQNQVADLY